MVSIFAVVMILIYAVYCLIIFSFFFYIYNIRIITVVRYRRLALDYVHDNVRKRFNDPYNRPSTMGSIISNARMEHP